MSICCGCLVDITRLMEDCDGLMGLKVTLTDLDFFFFSFFLGGGGGGGQTVPLYSAYSCLWHTIRLKSFPHYYFPQVLSMVT